MQLLLLLTPPATAERSVVQRRCVYGLLAVISLFFCARFYPKFLNRWVRNLAAMRELVPKETIESFITIAVVVF